MQVGPCICSAIVLGATIGGKWLWIRYVSSPGLRLPVRRIAAAPSSQSAPSRLLSADSAGPRTPSSGDVRRGVRQLLSPLRGAPVVVPKCTGVDPSPAPLPPPANTEMDAPGDQLIDRNVSPSVAVATVSPIAAAPVSASACVDGRSTNRLVA